MTEVIKTLHRVVRGYGKLKELTGYGRTQIQKMIADGDFPKPVRLGPRAKGWLESEIASWQAERIAARDGGNNG